TGKDIIRIRSSQCVMRYKTVESPTISKSGQLPSAQHLTQDPQNMSVAKLPAQDPTSHPPLQRTRTSRNRPRYSFKARKGVTTPPPPKCMKQNVFKPYKENTDTLGEPSDPETPPKIKIKPVLKTLTSRSSSKRLKLAIKRQMAYHHPVSSLDV
ncbi:hypothetical protein BGZ75_002652, partial [Mortierella antarctica]